MSVIQPRNKKNPPGSSNAILLVDDDTTLLDIGERLLKRLDYEVYTAEGCEEAVRLTKAHAARLTCAIIDLSMPDIDGIETCRRVRQVKPDIRVIISSGYLKAQIQDQVAEVAPDETIQKPFQLNDLLTKLRYLCGHA